jgi:hypothetical protein
MRVQHSAALGFVAAMALASVAQADPLVVTTRESGDWATTVDRLQRSPETAGQSLHVVVSEGSRPLDCNSYRLAFDEPVARAFQIAACEPDGTTLVRLVDRSALFDHEDGRSRPRAVVIGVTQVRHASAVGRADNSGGSELRCSLAVRPYRDDLEHGTREYLTPERYQLRVTSVGVSAEASRDGWTVRGGAAEVSYEVVDPQHGMDVVVRDRVRLACTRENTPAPVESPATVAPPLSSDGPGTLVHVESDASGLRIDGQDYQYRADVRLAGQHEIALGSYEQRTVHPNFQPARQVAIWHEEWRTTFAPSMDAPMTLRLSLAQLYRQRRLPPVAWVAPIVWGAFSVLATPFPFAMALSNQSVDVPWLVAGTCLLGGTVPAAIWLIANAVHAHNAGTAVEWVGPRAMASGVRLEGAIVVGTTGGALTGLSARF